MVSKGSCAFIQFAKRSSAELAAEKTFNKLVSASLVVIELFNNIFE
jgi:hypothetical protein